MAKIKLLICDEGVIGYSESMEDLTKFIEDFEITNYRIKKIKEIPEDIEYEYQVKEIVYDSYHDLYISEYIMVEFGAIAEGLASLLIGVDNVLLEAMEYLKLTPDEKSAVLETQQHIHDLVTDLVGIDESTGGGAFYSDYFDVKEVVKELIHQNINIYGRW